MHIKIFLTYVMHIISTTDLSLFCSNFAGRMLAPKIAYSARNSAGRIYPSLSVEPQNTESAKAKTKYVATREPNSKWILWQTGFLTVTKSLIFC